MMPSVSVLIPTFSRPLYLERALASVLLDAPHDAEVIVGDDGRLGKEVVQRAGDSRVRYVPHPQRLGMAGNWNRLAELARGDAVLFLMDDDRLLPGFFAASLPILESMPDVGVVFTNHFFEQGDRLLLRACPLQAGHYRSFSRLLIEHNPVPISAALIRLAPLRRASPLPNIGAADLVLWGRLAQSGWGFFYVDMPLMIYKRHTANYSANRTFRSEVVCALEQLRFSDPIADRIRQCRLADALLGRAANAILSGDVEGAQQDLERARALGPSSRFQAAAVRLAVRSPLARRIAHIVSRTTRRRPWSGGWRVSG